MGNKESTTAQKKRYTVRKIKQKKKIRKIIFGQKKEKRRCCSSMDVRQKGNDEMTAHDILHLFSSYIVVACHGITVCVCLALSRRAGDQRTRDLYHQRNSLFMHHQPREMCAVCWLCHMQWEGGGNYARTGRGSCV
jgi:hypothetical protein